MMKLLRASRFVGRWLWGFLADTLCWILWTVLAVLLAAQIYIASSRQIAMPAWMLRQLETRFASAGLRVHFERAVIDPLGRVAVEQLQISSAAFDAPFITAKNFYVHFNPWALLSRELEPRDLRVGGATFWVPAMLSPSGRREPAVQDVSATLRLDRQQIDFEQFTGRIANLAFSVRGAIALPKNMALDGLDLGSVDGRGDVRTAVRNYVKSARAIAALHPELSKFEDPSIELTLTPDARRLALVDARWSSSEATENLARFGAGPGRIHASGLRAFARFPIASDTVESIYAGASAENVVADQAEAHDVQLGFKFDLGALYGSFTPRELLASCATLDAGGQSFDNLWVRAEPQPLPRLQVEAHTRAIGSIWSVQGEAETQARSASLQVDGNVTNELIRVISERIGHDLTIVQLSGPAAVRAKINLGDGWKFEHASGDLSSGPLIAAPVPFDRISGDFDFDGEQLRITHMSGRQKRNYTRGDYLMNARTHEFSFLLRGRLSPIDISGWFRDWWSGFWNNFDFSFIPPEADVQVSGRWGFPHLTVVFAHADVEKPSVRSVPLDRLRATMFIRPEFYDAMEFLAARDGGVARGIFTRSVDLQREGEFRWMTFDVTSDLDLTESARIFGPAGLELVEPFGFAQAPTMRLNGRIDGPASPGGAHETIEITLQSKGAFAFHKFPLSDLSFHAKLRDDDLDLEKLNVKFAGGQVRARAFLSGKDAEQRLRFDGTLTHASFNDAISTLEKFAAQRHGQAEKSPRFHERNVAGRLKLHAAAEGFYRDPLSFKGGGSFEITEADLGEINLLGGLSKLLRDSALGFTTLELTTARSTFVIDHATLSLPDLTILGPSADLEAKGNYRFDAKEMDFNAKLYPFEHGKTLLANAVSLMLVPVSNALEFKLTGMFNDPRWRFSYGPTSLLRTLKSNKGTAAPTDPGAAGRKQPPPLLRR